MNAKRLHGLPRSALAAGLLLTGFSALPGTLCGQTTDPEFAHGADHRIYALGLQPDTAMVVGGEFTAIGGQTRHRLARIPTAGDVDSAFTPAASDKVNAAAVQGDGKIVVGGLFGVLAGSPRNRLARLNADGSLDADFDPGVTGAFVSALAIQPDGKIIVGGEFTAIDGVAVTNIARLHPNGTVDANFNPGASGDVQTIVLQEDGKIVVAGKFGTLGGAERMRIGRLHNDGSLDESFDPDAGGWVNALAVQPDGKILAAGGFQTMGGEPRNRLARLNADGSLDASFDPNANAWVDTLALQTDGKILVGGNFTAMGGQARAYIARLNADGSADAAFDPGANGRVDALALQTDGRILVTGSFSELGGEERTRIGRLLNDTAAQQALEINAYGTRLFWSRSGSAPEVQYAVFEQYDEDTATYLPLGVGTRSAGGWELDGLTLSMDEDLTLRVRGHYATASLNGSVSISATVRVVHFSTAYSVAVAADPEDGGAVTGGGFYEAGSNVTVNAQAHDGFEFVNWTENGFQVSTLAEYTFEAVQDRALTAHFVWTAYRPGEDSVVTDRRAAFRWPAVDGATWYQLVIRRNESAYLSTWIEGATTWSPSANGLPGGDYEWWVRAWGPVIKYGPWTPSSTVGEKFSIVTQSPGTIALVAPEGAQAGHSIDYRWQKDINATWYRLWVGRTGGGTFHDRWYALTGDDEASVNVTGHTQGDYTWWLQAWGPDGYGEWSGPKTFSAPDAHPAQPVLTAPSGLLTSNTPLFQWKGTDKAEWYRLFVMRGSTKVVDRWTQDTSLPSPVLLRQGDHSWWVSAWNSVTKTQKWSQRMDFTTPSHDPAPPVPLAPLGDITETVPVFTWETATNAQWYRVFVRRDADAATVMDRWTQDTSLPATQPLNAGGYTWWVGSWNDVAKKTVWSSDSGHAFTVVPE